MKAGILTMGNSGHVEKIDVKWGGHVSDLLSHTCYCIWKYKQNEGLY